LIILKPKSSDLFNEAEHMKLAFSGGIFCMYGPKQGV